MKGQKLENIDARHHIIIKGAKTHNLQNVDVVIPRNKFVVITGVSGSGKSSLAFDTLYAEGQRRYIESLSAYARQFMGKIEKPPVDYIKGISPAIAIEQKVSTRNPRSTVGTSTEIYDYLKLLFARIGKTISPVSGKEVKRHSVKDVVEFITKQKEGSKVYLLAERKAGVQKVTQDELQLLSQQGFSRILLNDDIVSLSDAMEMKIKKDAIYYLLIDRFITKKEDEDLQTRIADSVQTAFYEGQGECEVYLPDEKKKYNKFSNKFELDGVTFEEPSVHFFSFNSPVGACKTCEGFGSIIGIDEHLVIPNRTISVYEDAIVCWRGEKMKKWKEKLITNAHKFNFPVHKPIEELSNKEYQLLWKGNEHFKGIDAFFESLEEQAYKIQYRVMLARYRGKTKCKACNGTRLREDASYVKVNNHSIQELVLLPVDQLIKTIGEFQFDKYEQQVSKRLILEINSRLRFLDDVGLGYLTLNRLSNTLSGGESQRINLATSLGSSLVGSMYILDEPSIGLHPRDTQRLIKVLSSLRDIGNTVIVVEHDEDIMQASDQIIDMGLNAGRLGGQLIFQGTESDLENETESWTARYLTGKETIDIPSKRRTATQHIEVKGAAENNLKNLNVKFPLNLFTVVTGVSGSGKSSLVRKVLYPAVKRLIEGYGDDEGKYDKLDGSLKNLVAVEFVDQNPIGKSSRSNPVTYVKAYDDIRTLYASQPLAKTRGYKASQFSFNVDGGRCEVCEGDGKVKIEMQFMADITLTCETCNGKRFKDDTLEITYKEKNIAEILELTVDEAMEFFNDPLKNASAEKKILAKLKPLQDVGLGYVSLGQASSTLSGGEAQRIKLASFLIQVRDKQQPTLFIFDEPTTGLHFHDIKKLLYAFEALLDNGHSLVVIEHNQDVIKCADWVIDLGPEGGEKGGHIVFEGTPEDLTKCDTSYTGKYLAEKLQNQAV